MALKCTDPNLQTYTDGDYTAQQRWTGNYRVWFKDEDLGVANTISDAEKVIAERESTCPTCGLPHPNSNPYCFCKPTKEIN